MHERKARLKAELRNARGLVNSFTLSDEVGMREDRHAPSDPSPHRGNSNQS